MIVPGILFCLSLALAAFAVFRSGPVLSDLFLLAVISGVASLILLFRPRRKSAKPPGPPARYIVVDGSNVMHWKDATPQLSTVREVVQELTARGFHPGVIFDANVGWKITGRYQDDAEVAMVLGLPKDRVLVVPKGVQADPYLLRSARDLGARVVSNDRFRDWAEAHPEVREPGFLLRGGYRDGKLWIEEGVRE